MRWLLTFICIQNIAAGPVPRWSRLKVAVWAAKKGLNLLGTGDFTHPIYLAELKRIMKPAEPGLFRLKSDRERRKGEPMIRFVLSSEVALFFRQNEKWRKRDQTNAIGKGDPAARLRRHLRTHFGLEITSVTDVQEKVAADSEEEKIGGPRRNPGGEDADASKRDRH